MIKAECTIVLEWNTESLFEILRIGYLRPRFAFRERLVGTIPIEHNGSLRTAAMFGDQQLGFRTLSGLSVQDHCHVGIIDDPF